MFCRNTLVLASLLFVVTSIDARECLFGENSLVDLPIPSLIPTNSFQANPDGSLKAVRIAGVSYPLSPPSGKVYGAAFHSRCEILSMVETSGTVRVMRLRDKEFELIQMRSPLEHERPRSVRFSRLPGLMYINYFDLRSKGWSVTVQLSPYRYQRIDLSNLFRLKIDGFPVSPSKENVSVLGGYLIDHGHSVYATLPADGGDDELELSFPSPLATSDRAQLSLGNLKQSMYFFPKRGFVSLTESSCSFTT